MLLLESEEVKLVIELTIGFFDVLSFDSINVVHYPQIGRFLKSEQFETSPSSSVVKSLANHRKR